MSDDWFVQLQREYASHLPSKLEHVRVLAEEGARARPALMQALHQMGGSAGTHGFDEVSSAAQSWERALRRQEDPPDALDRLERAVADGLTRFARPREQRRPTPAPRADGPRPRIVLVEDNPDNRLVVHALLDDRYVIDAYADARSGIAAIRAHPPDLLLLDIALPGMDGVEMLSVLRADSAIPRIPAIALTALAMTGDRERLLSEGFDDYVSKPIVDEQVLFDAIAKALART